MVLNIKIKTKRAEKLTTFLQTSVLLVEQMAQPSTKTKQTQNGDNDNAQPPKVSPEGERTTVSRFGGFPLNNRMTENSDALSPTDNRMRGWATAKKENYCQDILLQIVANGYHFKMPTS